jgi:tRNA threonylcarbamoyladenosine biosynthesis protein TsaE
MDALGRTLAGALAAGDVVILSGELGAGKTALTQGIGAGLQVVGPVISPTFVLARIHRSLAGGPDLVHVDAYRLTSPEEVDDLDLEATLADSVTVVEWGEGLADHLVATPWRILIERSGDPDDETRTVTIRAPRIKAGGEKILRCAQDDNT